MEAIIYEENPWDRIVSMDVAKGFLEPFARNEGENCRASGPSGILKKASSCF